MACIPVLVLACAKDSDVVGSGDTGAESDTAADEIGGETETETDTDTETDESGSFIPPEETGTETGEPEPPPTCAEMLDCVFMCLGDFGLECVQMCGENYDPAEVQKAGDLLLCIGQQCVEKEKCTLADFTSEDCIGCIGFGLLLPEPPGCEREAAACQ